MVVVVVIFFLTGKLGRQSVAAISCLGKRRGWGLLPSQILPHNILRLALPPWSPNLLTPPSSLPPPPPQSSLCVRPKGMQANLISQSKQGGEGEGVGGGEGGGGGQGRGGADKRRWRLYFNLLFCRRLIYVPQGTFFPFFHSAAAAVALSLGCDWAAATGRRRRREE